MNRNWVKAALATLVLSTTILMVSCSSSGDKVCTPGVTQECTCSPGVKGVQVCSDDGTKWGTCGNCSGSSDGGQGGPDGSVSDGSVTDSGTDGGSAADAGTDGGTLPDGGATCTNTGLTVTVSEAEHGNDTGEFWRFVGFTAGSYPNNKVIVENWVQYGGHTTPGTYPITTNETSMADCALCIALFKDCTAGGCVKSFMPKAGGTYTLTTLGTTVGGTFAGGVSNVTMQEVTIAEDLTTTPVPGGETWCLPSWNWSGQITATTGDAVISWTVNGGQKCPTDGMSGTGSVSAQATGPTTRNQNSGCDTYSITLAGLAPGTYNFHLVLTDSQHPGQEATGDANGISIVAGSQASVGPVDISCSFCPF